MTSRERMLTALGNGRPDRLPCQVHGWMAYYLNHTLGGMDQWQAYEEFGLDYAIYVSPTYTFSDQALANWQIERRSLGSDAAGNQRWTETITTPGGTLHHAGAYNEITGWETENLVKTQADFELFAQYYPLPTGLDLTPVQLAHERLGDRGIIRSHPHNYAQGSPWQCLCVLLGTQEAIMLAYDDPAFVHHALETILEQIIRAAELWAGTPADMVEIGGGAGSSTVISPRMFREFCLPYDQREVAAFHEVGVKIVYHLCGGLMPMLELVAETGADGLETMTPPSMGGDCNLRAASAQVGDQLFFIGGFDQNAGFERGTPAEARRQVLECFEATQDHAGYIIAPSDHFFSGNPENLRAFAQACRECQY